MGALRSETKGQAEACPGRHRRVHAVAGRDRQGGVRAPGGGLHRGQPQLRDRALAGAGLLMIEDDQPSRKQRRGKGKYDPSDAQPTWRCWPLRLDAAGLPVPRADGDREALRILLVARQEITVARTAQAGRLRALLLAGDDTDRRAARKTLSSTGSSPGR